jgi:hypothetical protein
MFNNLTIPYAGLLLACLLALACPLPFILIRYGEQIRAKSKYAAATTGLKDLQEKDEENAMSGPVLGARRSAKDQAPREAKGAKEKSAKGESM